MAVLESDYWATPDDIVKGIARYLHDNKLIKWTEFDLDCCANDVNSKVADSFITEQENALLVDWCGMQIWCNPPYSRGNIEKFIAKAVQQTEMHGSEVVMLLNVDPSTQYFRKIVAKARAVVYIVGGRIKFQHSLTKQFGDQPSKPSMFVLFGGERKELTTHYVELSTLQKLGA